MPSTPFERYGLHRSIRAISLSTAPPRLAPLRCSKFRRAAIRQPRWIFSLWAMDTPRRSQRSLNRMRVDLSRFYSRHRRSRSTGVISTSGDCVPRQPSRVSRGPQPASIASRRSEQATTPSDPRDTSLPLTTARCAPLHRSRLTSS